ncbi:TetR/AcrR family transcriptional regulator [Nocardiopsis trehalosi]|uniref:TetR/AcrR family transcriptional regulator n=1 Tax=Nocardiopsis trehalosi TaxID=109329 RepID=UPI000834A7C9|nr:TetR/AcrR family transcriptional regulator [Nocardiopsis trehalosi]
MSAAHDREIGAAPPDGGTRERLIAAAAELLGEGGPDAVTLRGVGERVGVSRTAPYRHFRDKGDLLAAVAAADFAMLNGTTAAILAEARDTVGGLRALLSAYVRFGIENPEHYRLLFGEYAPDHEALHAAGGDLLGDCADFLARGQAAGEIRPGDPRDLAILGFSSVHGLVVLALSGHLAHKGFSTEAELARLVHEIVRGFQA